MFERRTAGPVGSIALRRAGRPYQRVRPGQVRAGGAGRGLGSIRRTLPMLGPAFVAAVAYVDPGNFATNLQGGSAYGYRLVWVVVLANLMAMLVQYLAAKVGIATGRNLAELCRDRLPRPLTHGLWLQAELVAMATDLAEFVGAALALQLLFGVAPLPSGLLTAVVSFGLLGLQQRGCRRFELVIAGFLGVVLLGFGYQLLRVGLDPSRLAGGLVPGFAGGDSVLLASGIVGATIMPHAVYLHSALTQSWPSSSGPGSVLGSKPASVPGSLPGSDESRERLRGQRIDIAAAMSLAGLANLAMLVVAARTFTPATGGAAGLGGGSLAEAHAGLARAVGPSMALVFALALLAAGLSSSSVGTYAGQVVMQGYLHRRLPLLVRRLVTMAPALLVLGLGLDPTRALVLSQVALSFGIPFVLLPLVLLTARRDVMGVHANTALTTAAASVVVAAVTALNVVLLVHLVR